MLDGEVPEGRATRSGALPRRPAPRPLGPSRARSFCGHPAGVARPRHADHCRPSGHRSTAELVPGADPDHMAGAARTDLGDPGQPWPLWCRPRRHGPGTDRLRCGRELGPEAGSDLRQLPPPPPLDGPPGIGKSRWARRLGELLSLPISEIEATGENASFGGRLSARLGWFLPGRLIETVLPSRIAYPIMVVDEVEKAGQPSSMKGHTFGPAPAREISL